jgi:hypothetical protein
LWPVSRSAALEMASTQAAVVTCRTSTSAPPFYRRRRRLRPSARHRARSAMSSDGAVGAASLLLVEEPVAEVSDSSSRFQPFSLSASVIILLGLCLGAASLTLGLGVLLLRGVTKDATELASHLSPRFIKEDTSQARERNRLHALSEMRQLLLIRSLPGVGLILFGAMLLSWPVYHVFAALPKDLASESTRD